MGPWGGNKGNEFNDETFSGIREIKIGYGRWIYSITVVYDRDNVPQEPIMHGKDEDQSTRSEIKFAEVSLIS